MTKKIKIKSPLITLKFFDENDEIILSTQSRKKKRILYFIQKGKFKKCYLKVQYDKEFSNSGTYHNIKDLKKVLDAFTERSLCDHLSNNQ